MNVLHGRWRHSCALGAIAIAALLFASPPARADGGNPRGYGILFEPGNPSHVVLHSQFWGLFDSRSGPMGFKLLCSQAFGGRTVDPDYYPTVIAQGGRILVAADFDGLIVSDDTCSWRKIDAFDGIPVPTIAAADAVGTNFLAVTVASQGGNNTSRVYSSTDRGDTWTKLNGTITTNVDIDGIAAAPSDPKRIYGVGVVINGGPRMLAVSRDGGATFDMSPLAATTEYDRSQVAPLSVAGIVRNDPDTLFVRADGSDSSGAVLADELWVSSDAGKTWKKAYQPAGDLPGFAFTPDGKNVLVAGPLDGIEQATLADAIAAKPGAFTKIYPNAVWGLAFNEGKLYAGNDDNAMKPPFMFGVSTDGGKTFASLMRHCDVAFPTCSTDSTMEKVCRDEWTRMGGYVYDYIDVDTCRAGSGGAPGAGGASGASGSGGAPTGGTTGATSSLGGAPATSRSSGCSLGTSPRRGSFPTTAMVVLMGIAAALLRRSRTAVRPRRAAIAAFAAVGAMVTPAAGGPYVPRVDRILFEPGMISVSTDGGATFESLPLGAMTDYDATEVTPLSVVGIVPSDPDTLFVRADGSDNAGFVLADELWVSSDAGKTWKKTYQPGDMHDLPGFSFTPDGKNVLVAGPGEGIREASLADALAAKPGAFTPISSGAIWGIAFNDRKLYAGTDDYAMSPPFMFGVSTDDGRSFSPLLHHCDVEFPRCSAGSTIEAVCRDPWERFGGYVTDYIDSCRAADAGVRADAADGSAHGADGSTHGADGSAHGADGGEAESGRSSGCSVARNRRNHPFPTIAFVMTALLAATISRSRAHSAFRPSRLLSLPLVQRRFKVNESKLPAASGRS